jgi:hypothetical protein
VSDWLIERDHDTATRLHERSADLVAGAAGGSPAGVPRRIRVLDVDAVALVLGRAQPVEHVDAGRAAAAGVEVARRRSGGGAVLVVPHGAVWIDIVIPVGDPLWASDIGRAMWWVGAAWVAALAEVGLPPGEVWHGPLQRNDWSDRVCFAGLGAGEVTVGGKGGRGAKIVGERCSSASRWSTGNRGTPSICWPCPRPGAEPARESWPAWSPASETLPGRWSRPSSAR